MAKASSSDETAAVDVQEQIRQLRAQLDALLADTVAPAVQSAADQIGDAAASARGFAEFELEGLASQVRARPLTALLAAGALGYVLARLTR